jgi:ribonuclease T2
MQTYWKDYQGNDETFWEHEWGKHGTCISTLDPTCYINYQSKQEAVDFFARTINLFQSLPSYAWLALAGIVPSASTTYTSAAIQSALQSQHGYPVTIRCNKNGELNEIWYHFNVQGSVQKGTFMPANPVGSGSNCAASGVKYLPKPGGTTTLPTLTSSNTPPTSTSTSPVLSGKGFLNVVSSGAQNGCIISGGTWYTTSSCARFTATPSGMISTL